MRLRDSTPPARFTLVELAVVVALVAVLTAMAIPVVIGAKDRAREAEASVNLSGMHKAYSAYVQANSVGPPFDNSTQDFEPDNILGPCTRPWNGGPGWTELGYEPDGDVAGVYWALSSSGYTDGFYVLLDVNIHDADVVYCKIMYVGGSMTSDNTGVMCDKQSYNPGGLGGLDWVYASGIAPVCASGAGGGTTEPPPDTCYDDCIAGGGDNTKCNDICGTTNPAGCAMDAACCKDTTYTPCMDGGGTDDSCRPAYDACLAGK